VRVKIRGKVWTIRDADLDGNLGECTWADRLIEIQPRQSDPDRLDTLIHEMLHALYQTMAEKEVRRVAKALAEAIWKDGWRRG
jgi:hypothetical protein